MCLPRQLVLEMAQLPASSPASGTVLLTDRFGKASQAPLKKPGEPCGQQGGPVVPMPEHRAKSLNCLSNETLPPLLAFDMETILIYSGIIG